MFQIALVSFLGSSITVWLLILTQRIHGRLTSDHDTRSVHKFHKRSTLRVGGLSLFVGLALGGVYHGLIADNSLYLAKWAGIAALPVFLGGFFEDITKRITARDRLLLAFLSAAVAYYELNVQLTRVGWPWFDQNVLTYPGVSLVLTIFLMGGVAHSTNIIDGFHGLLSGFAILALLAFSFVAHGADDLTLLTYSVITISGIAGVLVFNFPFGKIFLGDGGAYLIGFLLALFSILLVNNTPEVSPWYPLTVLIYPIFETLFSIYRKSILGKTSAMEPDRLHLHMLVYRGISPRFGRITAEKKNPLTGFLMCCFGLPPIILATVFYSSTPVLILICAAFCFSYTVFYRALSKRFSSLPG